MSLEKNRLYSGEREEDMYAFDQNGHLMSSRDIINTHIYRVMQSFETDASNVDNPDFTIAYTWMGLSYNGCSFCGQTPPLAADGEKRVVRVTEPCPTPEGITTEFYLDVPSGKIVVDDDLRPIYDFGIENLEHDYNTALGQSEMSIEMAKLGCAYGAVGNSCPNLYQTGEGTYVIATPDYGDDDAEDTDEPVSVPGKELAGICTDLWAYSIADYDDWIAKGGKETDHWAGPTVVEIPAGRYKFTHLTGRRGFDGWASGEITYATIEKIS